MDPLIVMGSDEKALHEIRYARDLDPLSLSVNTAFGALLYFSGDVEQARLQFHRTLALEPRFVRALIGLGATELVSGNTQEAIRLFERAQQIIGSDVILPDLVHAYAAAGDVSTARKLLTRMHAESGDVDILPVQFALVYGELGELDAAFEWLEVAYRERDQFLDWLVLEPRFSTLRSDPRFLSLVRRIGLPILRGR